MSETKLPVADAPAEPCMRIEIDRYGTPRTFRLLPSEETASLWTLGGGFPFVRTKTPLFDAPTRATLNEAEWERSDVMRKLVTLRGLLRRGAARQENGDYFISDQELSALDLSECGIPAPFSALAALAERFPREAESGAFAKKLFQLFSEKLDRVQTGAELDFLKALLCGDRPQLLCFELYEWRDYPNCVCSLETRRALTEKLQ